MDVEEDVIPSLLGEARVGLVLVVLLQSVPVLRIPSPVPLTTCLRLRVFPLMVPDVVLLNPVAVPPVLLPVRVQFLFVPVVRLLESLSLVVRLCMTTWFPLQ